MNFHGIHCGSQGGQEPALYMIHMGLSLNGGTPISHPMCWLFLVGKPMVVGETHHFRQLPHMYIFISVEKVGSMFHPDVLRKFVAHDGQAMDPMVHGRNRKWRKWNRNPPGAAFGLRCFRLSAARRRVSVKILRDENKSEDSKFRWESNGFSWDSFFCWFMMGFFQKITRKTTNKKPETFHGFLELNKKTNSVPWSSLRLVLPLHEMVVPVKIRVQGILVERWTFRSS